MVSETSRIITTNDVIISRITFTTICPHIREKNILPRRVAYPNQVTNLIIRCEISNAKSKK